MRFLLTLLVSLQAYSSVYANVFYRPMHPEDLIRPVADVMYRLKGCKVVFFHEAALKRDFPFLRGLPRSKVSNWIEENFCFMSSNQFHLEGIRCSGTSTFCDRQETKIGYRQPTWGRAATVPVTDLNGQYPPEGGMVDLKGIGHASSEIELHKTDAISIEEQHRRYKEALKITDEEERQKVIDALRTDVHSDGLMYLRGAVIEFFRNAALQLLFNERNVKRRTRPENALQTVENYFLLVHQIRSYGKPDQISAIMGRQAHVGRSFSLGGTKGIYEDYLGRRQADIFAAAIDMGAVELTDPRFEGSDEAADRATDRFMQGDTNAIYDELMKFLEPMKNPTYRCVKDEFGFCIDMRKPFTLKYALKTVFGRGKRVDREESNRPRYNKDKNPKETYNSETFRLFEKEARELYRKKYPDAKRSPEFYSYRKQWWKTLGYETRQKFLRLLQRMRIYKEKPLESWQ